MIFQEIQVALAMDAEWRHVFGAMQLVEHLLEHGSAEMVRESVDGLHFDIIQKLSFLEKYKNEDPRVNSTVQTKAKQLRERIMATQADAMTADLNSARPPVAAAAAPFAAAAAAPEKSAAAVPAGFSIPSQGGAP